MPRLEGWPAERIASRTCELLEQVDLAPCTVRQTAIRASSRAASGSAWAWRAHWPPNPSLLLFDEPFGALDPVTRLELQNQFLALRDRLRKTSIFVTHDVREALRIGTRIALLDRGRLETLATPEQFLKSPAPQTRAFLAVLDGEQRAKGEQPESRA